jgi:hypothetical protein
MWPDISIGTCGKKIRIFYSKDFEIIVFERRRKSFFGPYPTRSAGFDSPLHQKVELHKVELLMYGMSSSCGKNLRGRGPM